jgi:hypothetical protein
LSVALFLGVGCIGVGLFGPATARAQDPDCGVPVAVAIANAGFEEPTRPPFTAVLVAELPGWTLSGQVRHSGPSSSFESGSQAVLIGGLAGGGQLEQALDGAALRGQTVTFQVVSLNSGTLTLGGQSAELVGPATGETTHEVSFDVPADAPDALPLRLSRLSSGAGWLIDSVSASYTPPCPTSADVRVSLSGPASARRGSFVTYTLEVTNDGEGAATDVTSVIGAAGLSDVTTSPPTGTGSVTIDGRRLSGARWTTPTLAPGDRATFTLRGKVAVAAGNYVVVSGGALAADPPDPRLANNIAFTATRSSR